MRFFLMAIGLLLVACTVPGSPAPNVGAPEATGVPVTRQVAIQNFARVVATVEPVAEKICRQRAPNVNCDFGIVVDTRPELGSNAFQTQDRSGRPIIAFTPLLIAETRNVDELAFVLSHEAAHHIEGHILRTQRNANVGALVFGQLAGAMGINDPDAIVNAQNAGAIMAARRYSKDFELEADALGARIAAAAGYDPLKGADFFFRIPDPGDKFLGSHPSNAERRRIVQRVVAGL